jgi:hypothetical protein
MRKTITVVVLQIVAACGGEDPPSCQQEMASYYGGGCSFVNLSTNQPISQNEATGECQSLAGSIRTACDDLLDDWLSCLDATSPAEQCDCSQEQMALLRCE